MSVEERREVLAKVDEVRWGKRQKLRELDVPRSTYYRWRQQARGVEGIQVLATLERAQS